MLVAVKNVSIECASAWQVTYPHVWLFRTMSDSALLKHSFVLFCGYEQGAGMAEGRLGVREGQIQTPL